MKKPRKGKPRRPRGPRKKSKSKRTSLRQHILFARRWCRRQGIPADVIRKALDGEPDNGNWVIDAGDEELEIDAPVRGALLGILDHHDRI